jgi:hypothetical protein
MTRQHAQNEAGNLNLLAARNQPLNWVGLLSGARFTVDAILALSAVIAVGFLKASWASWITFPSVVWLACDRLILKPLEQRLIIESASIQETFDTRVFSLPSNHMLPVREVTPERITSLCRRYRSRYGENKLIDWYPLSESNISPYLQHIMAQRCVFEWDSRQRKTYAKLLFLLLALLLSIAATIALATNPDARSFTLGVAVPIVPLGTNLGALASANLELSRRKHDAADKIMAFIREQPTVNCLASTFARSVQDVAFLLRTQAPWIPNRIYSALLPSYTADAKQAIEDLSQMAARLKKTH